MNSIRPVEARGNWNVLVLLFFSLIYLASAYVLVRSHAVELTELLIIFLILGMTLPALSWLLTRKQVPLELVSKQPRSELALLLIYSPAVALFLVFGLSWLSRVRPGTLTNEALLLAAKLMVFVVVPLVAFRLRWSYRPADLAPCSLNARRMLPVLWLSVVVTALQFVIGRGLAGLREAALPNSSLIWGIPLAFVWLAVEAGVVEEFFFRVLLQTRLSRLLRSDLSGIILASLLFGLVHAPGLYLRAGSTGETAAIGSSPLIAAAYSICVISVSSWFLGVLWARTRNFMVPVLVHAAADLVPNLVPLLKAWRHL